MAIVEAEISKAAELLGSAGPERAPFERLLQLAGETEAWLEQARLRVGALLDSETLTTFTEAGEDVKAMVKVYERALDRTALVLTKIAGLKIDDRLTAIQERDLVRVEAAIEAAHHVGRQGGDLDEARSAASRVLRGLAA